MIISVHAIVCNAVMIYMFVCLCIYSTHLSNVGVFGMISPKQGSTENPKREVPEPCEKLPVMFNRGHNGQRQLYKILIMGFE